MVGNIFSLKKSDLSSLSYSDIAPGTNHFRSRVVSRTRNPNGTWSVVTKGEYYFKTPIGDLDEKEWDKIALEVVREHGDEALLEKIKAHVREYCLWLKDNEIERYSLKCLISKAYVAWAKRGEFEI